MVNLIPVTLRVFLRDALIKFNNRPWSQDSKRDLFRIMLLAEEQGWKWTIRNMYGGGQELNFMDGLDTIASVYLPHVPPEKVGVSFMTDYLREDFVPTVLQEYNEELDAELRNEEALYRYELPRPWRDAWFVVPKRDWEEPVSC
ncbi:hypothetical protein D3C71_1455570 [compost metagenome]